MVPTGLPDLSKPSRATVNLRKAQLFTVQSKQTKNDYAHIEVVVTLVVVNFFGFLVIARYPTVRLSRKSVEKLRTGLPDLPKPLRTNILLRKP